VTKCDTEVMQGLLKGADNFSQMNRKQS